MKTWMEMANEMSMAAYLALFIGSVALAVNIATIEPIPGDVARFPVAGLGAFTAFVVIGYFASRLADSNANRPNARTE